MLLRDRVDQEVRPYVVDVRNEDRVVVGRRVGRVVVVVHVRLPVNPFSYKGETLG